MWGDGDAIAFLWENIDITYCSTLGVMWYVVVGPLRLITECSLLGYRWQVMINFTRWRKIMQWFDCSFPIILRVLFWKHDDGAWLLLTHLAISSIISCRLSYQHSICTLLTRAHVSRPVGIFAIQHHFYFVDKTIRVANVMETWIWYMGI